MAWFKAIGAAISGLFGGYVDLKKAKMQAEGEKFKQLAKAEADWDTEALRQSQFSWKDEAITFVWLSPLVVAWKYPEKAQAWVDFISQLPMYYWIVMFGIVATSFGLRWYFKQQNLNVAKVMKQ